MGSAGLYSERRPIRVPGRRNRDATRKGDEELDDGRIPPQRPDSAAGNVSPGNGRAGRRARPPAPPGVRTRRDAGGRPDPVRAPADDHRRPLRQPGPHRGGRRRAEASRDPLGLDQPRRRLRAAHARPARRLPGDPPGSARPEPPGLSRPAPPGAHRPARRVRDPRGPPGRVGGRILWEHADRVGGRGGEPLDRLPRVHAERLDVSGTLRRVARRARPPGLALPAEADLDGGPSPAAGADADGPRGGHPPRRVDLRPGAAARVHPASLDPAEGPFACLRPKPRLTASPCRSSPPRICCRSRSPVAACPSGSSGRSRPPAAPTSPAPWSASSAWRRSASRPSARTVRNAGPAAPPRS